MCLLVSQPASTKFDDDFIKGVYRLNSDGLGVMYAEGSSLFINRIVPQNEADFVQFFRDNIEGRDCAWHARMKTHGHIDLTNCHPYQVLSAEEGYPLYLAHNGVLSTGNSKDISKSDTWHFIQDYLRPMLLKNPEFFLTEAFAEIIGDFIGSGNKFILMDAYGNQVVINEDRGVQHEGAWLSNTYAWDTHGTKYSFANTFPKGSTYGRYGGNYNYSPADAYAGKSNSLNPDWNDLEYEEDLYGGYGYGAVHKAGAQEEYAAANYSEEEFCITLFGALDNMGLVHKDIISWEDAETYYKIAGDELAWDVIEAIEFGAYTQEEIVDELTYFSKVGS